MLRMADYPDGTVHTRHFTIRAFYGQVTRMVRIGIALENGAYYSTLMRTISLKLPDDLLDLLDSEARARQMTKSSLVRESLEKALRRQSPATEDSCYDLASDLAGALKGLPRDLADNPKYLKGFGE